MLHHYLLRRPGVIRFFRRTLLVALRKVLDTPRTAGGSLVYEEGASLVGESFNTTVQQPPNIRCFLVNAVHEG